MCDDDNVHAVTSEDILKLSGGGMLTMFYHNYKNSQHFVSVFLVPSPLRVHFHL